MSNEWEYAEKSLAYYLCLFLMLLPIIIILLLPLSTAGLSQLPWALLICFIVFFPLVSCGSQFKGRPLFQFHYHGTPFDDEVMNISDDEKGEQDYYSHQNKS